MSSEDLSDALCALIVHHMPSMDHVAILLAVRAQPELVHVSKELAESQGLSASVVERALRDLHTAGLVRRDDSGYRYHHSPQSSRAVEELAQMYHSKPLALVRTIYARPGLAARTFADAFRLRKRDE